MAEAFPEEDASLSMENEPRLAHLKTLCENSKDVAKVNSLSSQECFLLLLLLVNCSILLSSEDKNDVDLQNSSTNSSVCLLCPRQTPNTDDRPSGHAKRCSYDMFTTRKQLAPENAEELERFRRELRELWNSSKCQVALEFGFSADEVAFVLAGYAAQGKVPQDAAELIDKLDAQDFEQKSFIYHGFAAQALDSRAKTREKVNSEASNQSAERAAHIEETKESEKSIEDRQKLLKETNLLLWMKKCYACRRKDADVLIADCGHISLCSGCSKQCATCPRCDGPSTLKIKVFTA